MNWVGGARKRIKIKNEKKIQKMSKKILQEFFERRRQSRTFKRLQGFSSAPKQTQGISQDILNLQLIMSTYDKPHPKVPRQPTKIDMERKNFKRWNENIELPMSPCKNPSYLDLHGHTSTQDNTTTYSRFPEDQTILERRNNDSQVNKIGAFHTLGLTTFADYANNSQKHRAREDFTKLTEAAFDGFSPPFNPSVVEKMKDIHRPSNFDIKSDTTTTTSSHETLQQKNARENQSFFVIPNHLSPHLPSYSPVHWKNTLKRSDQINNHLSDIAERNLYQASPTVRDGFRIDGDKEVDEQRFEMWRKFVIGNTEDKNSEVPKNKPDKNIYERDEQTSYQEDEHQKQISNLMKGEITMNKTLPRISFEEESLQEVMDLENNPSSQSSHESHNSVHSSISSASEAEEKAKGNQLSQSWLPSTSTSAVKISVTSGSGMLINGTRTSSFRLHNPFFKTNNISTQTTPNKPIVDKDSFPTPSRVPNGVCHREQCVPDHHLISTRGIPDCPDVNALDNFPLEYQDSCQQTEELTRPKLQDVSVGSTPLQTFTVSTQASFLDQKVTQASSVSVQTSSCSQDITKEETPDTLLAILTEVSEVKMKCEKSHEALTAKLREIEILLKENHPKQ